MITNKSIYSGLSRGVFGHVVSGCLFALLVSVSGTAYSATLSGEITFLKRPPYAGIVYVLGGGTEVSEKPLVDQKDKVFTKRVIPSSKGQTITFNNTDDVDHNIFAQDKKTGAKFDLGLMPPGNTSTVEANWPEHSLVRIGCKIHPKMRAYIANVPSAHYATFKFRDTEPPYSFSIDNIPKGATKAVVILPNYDSFEVDLKPGLDSKTALMKKGKPKGDVSMKYLE